MIHQIAFLKARVSQYAQPGQWSEVLQITNRLLESAPVERETTPALRDEILLQRAHALLGIGDERSAMKDLHEILLRNPDHMEALLRRAYFHSSGKARKSYFGLQSGYSS